MKDKAALLLLTLDKPALGGAFKAWRGGRTQQDIADLTGLSLRTIQEVEQGNRSLGKASKEKLRAYAESREQPPSTEERLEAIEAKLRKIEEKIGPLG